MNELELNKQLIQQDFILKVAKQIEKDINRCGYPFEFSEDLNPELIFKETEHIITKINGSSPNDLLKLCYLIDLSEKIVELYKVPSANIDAEGFSIQVVKREAYKVYLRNNL
ncbi:MAG: hypothetical protein ACPGU5_07870 [Lishizhenia sp.]